MNMKYILENNQVRFDFSKSDAEKEKLAQTKSNHTQQLISFYTRPIYDMFRKRIINCNEQLRTELVTAYAKDAIRRRKAKSADFAKKLKSFNPPKEFKLSTMQ